MSGLNLPRAAQALHRVSRRRRRGRATALGAKKFDAAELDEAVALFEVFQAVSHLRGWAALKGLPVH